MAEICMHAIRKPVSIGQTCLINVGNGHSQISLDKRSLKNSDNSEKLITLLQTIAYCSKNRKKETETYLGLCQTADGAFLRK